jgi:iron-sulfur cluster repair protein YtfE (RIC family)
MTGNKNARAAMDTILDFLGSDHRLCDELFASAKAAVTQRDWDSARGRFDHFHAAMQRHLAREENVLFPAFEARTANTMGPTQVMRMEHGRMRRLMQDMARATADEDHSRYLCLAATLQMLLQQHNLKEEELLFPMIDLMLDDAHADLIGAMQAIAG